LARLYAERGTPGPAIDRLRDLVALTAPSGLFADLHRKGRELLAELEAR
ncbi:MAG: hypothetical protein GWN07_25010, partial [Actinobacteria bacterium]|nr:hypothetical protein [Actinomycetota bacterium]NIS33835.1 hypothetical protein [Actinomycetota bacterium]NIU68659.1 hypothetical protein [Actinomycetota bacterium]NIW30505.1 hypothetical protein [Actinomycetota bacterium]NIX22912.1 hypothetical protein [Actinomycetota bacterium]